VSETNPFKWRHYESEIILLCVRWYLRYALGYRDLEEMMNERGLAVDHTTIYRRQVSTGSATPDRQRRYEQDRVSQLEFPDSPEAAPATHDLLLEIGSDA
jgi:transposase-like protein